MEYEAKLYGGRYKHSSWHHNLVDSGSILAGATEYIISLRHDLRQLPWKVPGQQLLHQQLNKNQCQISLLRRDTSCLGS